MASDRNLAATLACALQQTLHSGDEPPHLRVPGHCEAFQALLNAHQPDWQERRALLNSLPLLTP